LSVDEERAVFVGPDELTTVEYLAFTEEEDVIPFPSAGVVRERWIVIAVRGWFIFFGRHMLTVYSPVKVQSKGFLVVKRDEQTALNHT
jgi:hypothetical protein